MVVILQRFAAPEWIGLTKPAKVTAPTKMSSWYIHRAGRNRRAQPLASHFTFGYLSIDAFVPEVFIFTVMSTCTFYLYLYTCICHLSCFFFQNQFPGFNWNFNLVRETLIFFPVEFYSKSPSVLIAYSALIKSHKKNYIDMLNWELQNEIEHLKANKFTGLHKTT